MEVKELSIAGAWVFTPVQHPDERGVFLEYFRAEHFVAATGRSLELAQANHSVSARDVVRGIHYADVPPGQAKYVYCPHGAVVDVIVDIRVGSPTFGEWTSVRLDDVDRRAVFVSEGLGHGFVSLTEQSAFTYLCTTPFAPAREHTIHALDPEIGVDWGTATPRLSPRDAGAPSFAEVQASGGLPQWADCQSYVESLRRR